MEEPKVIYERLVAKADDFNVEKVIAAIKLIENLFSSAYLDEESQKAKRGGLKIENIHRIIYLLGCYNSWVEETVKTGVAKATLEVLELLKLAEDLVIVKRARNYEKILPRLRIKEEFDSAVFEVEMAVAYLNDDCNVSFVKERVADKMPDLEIKTPAGSRFYSECKARILKPIIDWVSLERYVTKQLRDSSEQFTLEGPGVLCLKFPYNQGLHASSSIMKKLEIIVKSKLKSNEKRKINKVDLLVPTYQQIENGEKEGFSYHAARSIIKHPNPLYVFPSR